MLFPKRVERRKSVPLFSCERKALGVPWHLEEYTRVSTPVCCTLRERERNMQMLRGVTKLTCTGSFFLPHKKLKSQQSMVFLPFFLLLVFISFFVGFSFLFSFFFMGGANELLMLAKWNQESLYTVLPSSTNSTEDPELPPAL